MPPPEGEAEEEHPAENQTQTSRGDVFYARERADLAGHLIPGAPCLPSFTQQAAQLS